MLWRLGATVLTNRGKRLLVGEWKNLQCTGPENWNLRNLGMWMFVLCVLTCSLCPYVKARSVYPPGHPNLILVATEQINQHSIKLDKRAAAKPFQSNFFSPGNNTKCHVGFRFLNQKERTSNYRLPFLMLDRHNCMESWCFQRHFSLNFFLRLLNPNC